MDRRISFIVSLALLIAATAAGATDYYVAATGSDSNTGTSASPFREIRRALTPAVAGDTIRVSNGQYKGFNVSGKNGTAASPITILATGSSVEIMVTTDRSDNRDTIFITSSSYVVIDGVKSFNGNRAAVRIDASPRITIRNSEFGNNGTWGVFTGFSDDVLIENNTIYGSKIEHGVYTSNSGDRPVIRGNRIYNNNANGIHMNGDISMGGDGIISNALVEKNIIYNNGAAGGSGINCDGVQNSVFRNNLIYDAHGAGICLYMIDAGAPSINNVVCNNTVDMASNGKWALQIHNGSSGCVAFNNIFLTHHLSRGSIHIDGASSRTGFVCDYNILTTINNCATINDDSSYLTFAGWKALGYDAHSTTATHASVFVNWSGGDFHLRAGSPAINTGIASLSGKSAPTIDQENNPRPSGSAYDMGCFEVQSSPTYSISGTVTLGAGGLSGVSVSDGTRSATTDASGNYTISGVPDGTYTVTPTRAGYTFTPTSRSVTVSGAAVSAVNYSATSTNTAPTISNIADRTINEDSNTGAVAFTISDAETAAGSLTLSRNSSNLTLVPLSGIVFGGSGGSRTVTVTPAANQFGTATITVTVSDGALTASDTFVLTVTSVNDAPTISNITDRTISQNGNTGAVAFTVADVETAAGSLTVAGNSSNLTLVPLSGIAFGGSGGSRTVTVTPAANQTGTATITVTVSDGALTASDTFVLTVTAANTAPTISNIADRTINEDSNTGAVAFTISDAETAAGSLTLTRNSSNLTLVPLSGIVFGGSGGSRTVTVTPAANQFGTATITVTVSDGSLTASDTFLLTVTSVNDAPVANNQSVSTRKNTAVNITLTASDVEGSALTYSIVTGPARGTLSGTPPNVRYTPNSKFSGADSFTFRANDGTANSNTATVSINVTRNAPTVMSTLTAAPSPATVGQTVNFAMAADDPDGDAMTYAWDFGDGTSASGVSGAHAYSSTGTFTTAVVVTDEDGMTATTSVTFSVQASDSGSGGGGSGGGGSGGGGGIAEPPTTALSVAKFGVKLNFASSGSDTIALIAALPIPESFSASGGTVAINIGGVVRSFTLDAKGSARSGADSLKLKFKSRKGVVSAQTGTLTLKLKGSFAEELAGEGLTGDASVTGKSVTVPIRITFNTTTYLDATPRSYSCKTGKTGALK